MLRPVTTSSAAASSAPVAVHASAAADLSASEARAATLAAANSARVQQTAANAQQMFRYNAFQFIYRQDIGRIVLIGQSPETGERVVQVPSEQALRAYQRTVRVQREQALSQTSQSVTPAPQQPSPQVAKALVAAVSGDNHGSGVISVSA